jgi:hypothetical protein
LINRYYRGWRWLGLICLVLVSSLATTFEPQQGSITIVKEASLESMQPFQFTSTITGTESFSLIDDGTVSNRLTIPVEPGLYQVNEVAMEGWVLEKAVCDNDDPVVAIEVGSGETVECTFYNLYEIVEPPVYFQFLPFLATRP